MWHPPHRQSAELFRENSQRYVADLELEIDRLRKQFEFVQHEVVETLDAIRVLSDRTFSPGDHSSFVGDLESRISELEQTMRDLREPPGYHPANDRVMSVTLRSLSHEVFLWHQRLFRAPHMQLNLDLQCEQIMWFPVRLRHILHNLISNAFKFRDLGKGETRLLLSLSTSDEAYELRLSDNGLGMTSESRADLEDFHRAIPDRPLAIGVGLPVVRVLVEQCGGTVRIESSAGKGTSVAVILPRFDVDDFLSR